MARHNCYGVGYFAIQWACEPGGWYDYWVGAEISVIDIFGVEWHNNGATRRGRLQCKGILTG